MAIELYDTTLRDGTQTEGISVTVGDKLRIAALVDALGVGYIEGGWPGANPKDTEFFARAADGEVKLANAELTAFGMTRRPNRDADTDAVLGDLLSARTDVVCIVGKSWDRHVLEAVGTTLEEGVAMVADSVAMLRREGRRVIFDAEHFFDGHRSDPEFALAVIEAAADAGAETVVLCDTNGGMLPDEVNSVTRGVVARIGQRARIGIHVHDDTGCAAANSMAALDAGATHVQGTLNGVGERTGNANLATIIPNLVCKRGLDVVAPEQLAQLSSVSHAVAEVMNLTPNPRAPYVGQAAFAHKAGLHASALVKDPDLYQHIEPQRVGNDLRLLVSDLAGRATIVSKGRDLGIDLESDRDAAARILERIKELEHKGWSFEAADASFELVVRAETTGLPESFRLESFRATVDADGDGPALAEATIKVHVQVDGRWERRLGAGEGNGPVDALDHAFRSAANGTLAWLDETHLVDFKVRVLDDGGGTGATTRVLARSSDGVHTWDTVGVSPNIIEASWLALADAYRYAHLRASERATDASASVGGHG